MEAKANPDRLTKILAVVAGLLCLVLLGIGAFYVGRQSAPGKAASQAISSSKEPKLDYSILNQIHDILAKDYVKPDNLDDQTLYEAAINGLLMLEDNLELSPHEE